LSEIQKEDMPPCGILIILLNWNVKKKLEKMFGRLRGKQNLT